MRSIPETVYGVDCVGLDLPMMQQGLWNDADLPMMQAGQHHRNL